MSNAETNISVKKEWIVADQKIDKIELLNSPQELAVTIKQSDENETKIQIEGNISEKIVGKLEKTTTDGNSLSIQLGANSALGLSYVPGDSDQLQMTVSLGKNTSVKEYVFDGTTNIEVTVPTAFDGTYQLTTNGEGEVTSVPKTKETQNSLLTVDVAGDINITK